MKTTEEQWSPAVEKLRAELGEIEMDVLTKYTLSDAIRSGSKVTEQQTGGFGQGVTACALSAARVDASVRGYVQG
jgi:hypothetical protein